jgi:hypothetical protein
MVTYTDIHQLDSDLILHSPSQSSLTVYTLNLALTKQDNTLIVSTLTFQVTPELYQIADTEALFNLKPELRGSLSHGETRTAA